MSETYISAYTECPECNEDIPATFTFEDGEEYSNTLVVRCQHCGEEFETEMDRSDYSWDDTLVVFVNGDELAETSIVER